MGWFAGSWEFLHRVGEPVAAGITLWLAVLAAVGFVVQFFKIKHKNTELTILKKDLAAREEEAHKQAAKAQQLQTKSRSNENWPIGSINKVRRLPVSCLSARSGLLRMQ